MAEEPDFNRDILPLLSENCFACHGPDAKVREAGLRLDREEAVFSKLESGATAIVPGSSSQSELVARLFSNEDDLVMPPADSGKKLTTKQKELIKRWIELGAKWSRHWAFVPPQKPTIPKPVSGWKAVSPIDLLVQEQLQKNGLAPEPTAGRDALIRRVTLDLIGLPPTVKEIDAFLQRSDAFFDGVFHTVNQFAIVAALTFTISVPLAVYNLDGIETFGTRDAALGGDGSPAWYGAWHGPRAQHACHWTSCCLISLSVYCSWEAISRCFMLIPTYSLY
ncbi:MAG: c-type cytochrome domain-containing protein, partial [Planctomycetota bacterium]|nr:c-type cytochrome domain-containing protein [Planctomycetota bacterium]